MEGIHGGDIYTHSGMLDFSANINPLGPEKHVIEAMKQSLSEIQHYPDVNCLELNKAIGAREQVLGSHILCGNGAAELIFSIVLALKPKKALLLSPSFSEYEQALKTVDCEIRYYDLKETDGFVLTEDYLDCLTAGIDIIFLCSPNNPTGRITKRAILVSILEHCRKHRIKMVMDECFNDFLIQPEANTMKGFLPIKELVILKAFTKLHAMPGIRLGYMMTEDVELLRKIESVRQPWSVSVTAQAGGVAALFNEEFPVRTRTYIDQERGYLCKRLKEIGVSYYEPSANFILIRSEINLFEQLKKQNILIRDCSNYRGLTKGYYRVAVKMHPENELLIKAIEEQYRMGE